MFKRIVAAFDGSEHAERILPWIKRYAGPDIAEVFLLRVIPLPPGSDIPYPGEVQEAKDYLYRMERELNYAGIPARVVVRTGPPAHAIAKTARLFSCNLVIVGTRGGSKAKRWLIGGTAEQVMRLAQVPVLVVRSQTPMPRQGKVRRVVVPLDGSPVAEAAVPWASRLARYHRAGLLYLHVLPKGQGGLTALHEENYEALARRILPLCKDLRASGIRTEFRLVYGEPAEKIVGTLRTGDALAMTTNGFGGLKRWVFGSVAAKVIQAVEVPVFIYRDTVVREKRQARNRVLVTT